MTMSAVSVQNLVNLKPFRVFASEAVGHIFVPDGFSYEEIAAVHISPLHGRSIALRVSGYDWINVKGGGWNYGGPQVYLSRKDEELVFGLYPFLSAKRELAVSQALEKISDAFPKVLYYKKLSEHKLPARYAVLAEAKFQNGAPVDPCLLYTRVKSPFRVADLMYFTDDEKRQVVQMCCDFWGIAPNQYTQKFTQELAKHVATMHKHGFINDTLDYANVTMLAEIIDYEWVTAPGILLPDGSYGLEITDARREKELLYGAEVCLQLKAMLQEPYALFDCYRVFLEAYQSIHPQFVEQCAGVRKMLAREEFIL